MAVQNNAFPPNQSVMELPCYTEHVRTWQLTALACLGRLLLGARLLPSRIIYS
jgi:hypothetical protein